MIGMPMTCGNPNCHSEVLMQVHEFGLSVCIFCGAPQIEPYFTQFMEKKGRWNPKLWEDEEE